MPPHPAYLVTTGLDPVVHAEVLRFGELLDYRKGSLTPPRQTAAQQENLHDMERDALTGAAWRVATSKPLSVALRAHYTLPNDFFTVPNAGRPPLPQSVFSAHGPFVYAGSIADWKGLEIVVAASRAAQVQLKIVGGTAEEWQRLRRALPADHVKWQPRVSLEELPRALTMEMMDAITASRGVRPSNRPWR